jgi:membrane protease YdiL (CAAX protease family)
MVFARLYSQQPLLAAISLRRFRPVLLLPIALTVCGLHVLLPEARNLLHFFLPAYPSYGDLFRKGVQTGNGTLVFAVVAAPLTEEALFRGIILGGFRRNYRAGLAVVLTSLLFGVMHLNLWQGITAFCLGLLLGWCMLRIGSLWPCIFGHAFSNFLGLAVAVAVGEEYKQLLGGASFQPLWLDLIGVLTLVAGIAWLRRATAAHATAHADKAKGLA